MAIAESMRLRVEKLVAGGEGLARHEGKAVFLPLALPGELVTATVSEEKGDFLRASIHDILEASPERITPPCPIYGECGGCNLQHLAYEAQLREKAAIVQETFRRVGRMEIETPPIAASVSYAYRNRLQLHLSPRGRIGFMRRSSSSVVEAHSCPIAVKSVDDWIRARAGSSWAFEELKNYIVGKDRFIVFGHEEQVHVEGRAGLVSIPVAGESVRFHIRGFFQSNLYLLDRFVPEVLEGLAGTRAADLYSGVGLFGRFLSRRYESVVMVEHNHFALALAKENAPGPTNEYHALSVEDFCRGPGRKAEFDLVLADPPRSGLSSEVRAWLGERRPPLLVYVSCDPVTLARDAAELSAFGYRLEKLKLFDFYPQTGHVECHARLRLE